MLVSVLQNLHLIMKRRLHCTAVDPNKFKLNFCLSAPSLHLSWKCTSILLNSLIHRNSWCLTECSLPTFSHTCLLQVSMPFGLGEKDKDLSKITNSSITVYLCRTPFTYFPFQCISELFCHVLTFTVFVCLAIVTIISCGQ